MKNAVSYGGGSLTGDPVLVGLECNTFTKDCSLLLHTRNFNG